MTLLRDMLGIDEMSPLMNNIGGAVVTLIYVGIVMELSSVVRDRFGKPELGRKVIHIAAASWFVFWPLFDTSHWSWWLNIAIPVAYIVKLLYLALILKDPNHEDVKNMSRSGDPMELLVGPFQFVLVMSYVGLFLFMQYEATIIMAALGIGDGIAPLVGKKWGQHAYKLPFMSSPKTLEGSIGGVFCGTIVGCCVYPPLLGFQVLHWRQIVALAAIATIGEGTAPFNCDNLVVPILIHYTFDRL